MRAGQDGRPAERQEGPRTMIPLPYIFDHALASARALALILAGSIAALASSAVPMSAQEPPALLPASPPSHFVTFQVETPGQAQYDEALTLQDFEPGAWTYERQHDGMA